MKVFVEQQIIQTIHKLLGGRVNEILREMEFSIPLIEIGCDGSNFVVAPAVILSSCERTEKERIIRLDSYSLAVTFEIPDTPESEFYCYAYNHAFCKAINENCTLDGLVNRVAVIGKKYIFPRKPYCGGTYGLAITMRLVIEENIYAN